MQNANYVSTERGSFWHRQTVLTTLTNREAEPSGTEARLAFLRGRKTRQNTKRYLLPFRQKQEALQAHLPSSG